MSDSAMQASRTSASRRHADADTLEPKANRRSGAAADEHDGYREHGATIGRVTTQPTRSEPRFLIDYEKSLRIYRKHHGPDAPNPVHVGMVGYLLYRKTDLVIESVTEGHAVARVTRGHVVKPDDLVSIDPSEGVRDIVLTLRENHGRTK
jgi:hypothetical protein